MKRRRVGTVLYDDSCGFCSRWVPFWAPTLGRRGFDIAPLQSSWVPDAVGLVGAELNHDIRLLLCTCRQVHGADVYRFVMKRIWWAYPVYVLSITPGLGWLFDQAYRTFARNRLAVSRACGLRNGTAA